MAVCMHVGDYRLFGGISAFNLGQQMKMGVAGSEVASPSPKIHSARTHETRGLIILLFYVRIFRTCTYEVRSTHCGSRVYVAVIKLFVVRLLLVNVLRPSQGGVNGKRYR
jgi:hypothetical protein